MRIFVLTSWFRTPEAPFGGSFFLDAAAAVAARGHEVILLAPRLAGLGDRHRVEYGAAPAQEERGVIIRSHVAPHWVPRYRGREARAFRRLTGKMFKAAVATHGKPDVLHAQSALFAGASAEALQRRGGPPYLLTEHSTAFREGKVKTWRIAHAQRAFAGAAVKSAVSKALARAIETMLGEVVRPIVITPNIVDDIFTATSLDQVKDGSRPVFLGVGRFENIKNFDGLIESFATVQEKVPGARLRLIGDGSRRESLEAQTRALGLSDAVTFLGVADRAAIAREMAKADCFVLPSHTETFGVVVIEALASGLPVIATACGGPIDLVTPEDGTLVSPGDAPALADAMIAFAAQPMPKSRQRRERALVRYSAESVGRQLESLLAEAAGQ